ncbi:CesT family type III secretion system chaperone [Pseudomonas aeruginosa]|uniref:CesT family type III secretion system chaperone n=1 Tax=Pseudomonas aeruginosa TaxID=287 RepID=UPI0010484BC0|nr:CesT family type III secretion system chaperone [Pseudomonas aeruginosa]
MDLTSKVNRLLAEFAGRIGLPSLSLDEEGMASLLFDEQVGVTLLLLAERERLLLEADVAGIELPCDSDREAVAAVGMRV